MAIKISSLTASAGLATGDVTVFVSGGTNVKATSTQILAGGGLAAGIGNVSTDRMPLVNSTAAGAGAQQFSPRIRFTGQGWKTNATAGSQQVDWIIENQPVQGTANPTTSLVFSSQVNISGYVPLVEIRSTGVLVVRQLGGTLGTNEGRIAHDGTRVQFANPAGGTYQFLSTDLSQSIMISGTSLYTGYGADVSLYRSAAGIIAIGTGTASGGGKLVGGTNIGSFVNTLDLSGQASFAAVDTLFPGGDSTSGGVGKGVFRAGQVSVQGTNDVFFQAIPLTGAGYGYLEAYNAAGLVLGTGGGTTPILFNINRVEKARFDTTGALILKDDATGVTSTDSVCLVNTTASSPGAQQFSGRIRFTGQGWKTNATAGNQQLDWIVENQPVQGAANPTSLLVFSSQVNGAGYIGRLSISSDGVFNLPAAATDFVIQINGVEFLRGKNTSGDTAFGSNLNVLNTKQIQWNSNVGLTNAGAIAVLKVTNSSSGSGWIQNTAGEACLASNFTKANATLGATNLSITLLAGRSYRIEGILQVSNTVAAEGAAFDFNGGAASATTFFVAFSPKAATPPVAGTEVSVALNTKLNYTTVTGTAYIFVSGFIKVNAGGTLILQASENTTSTGTMTLGAGSWLAFYDTVPL